MAATFVFCVCILRGELLRRDASLIYPTLVAARESGSLSPRREERRGEGAEGDAYSARGSTTLRAYAYWHCRELSIFHSISAPTSLDRQNMHPTRHPQD